MYIIRNNTVATRWYALIKKIIPLERRQIYKKRASAHERIFRFHPSTGNELNNQAKQNKTKSSIDRSREKKRREWNRKEEKKHLNPYFFLEIFFIFFVHRFFFFFFARRYSLMAQNINILYMSQALPPYT